MAPLPLAPITARHWCPTLVADADPASEIVRDEVFAPVLAVMPFDTDDEAIDLANDTPYGLAALAWARDVRPHQSRAEALAPNRFRGVR